MMAPWNTNPNPVICINLPTMSISKGQRSCSEGTHYYNVVPESYSSDRGSRRLGATECLLDHIWRLTQVVKNSCTNYDQKESKIWCMTCSRSIDPFKGPQPDKDQCHTDKYFRRPIQKKDAKEGIFMPQDYVCIMQNMHMLDRVLVCWTIIRASWPQPGLAYIYTYIVDETG